ncbi:MAG: D-2-hydroxyacid dehydrogenase [Pseudomonadota bacterium]
MTDPTPILLMSVRAAEKLPVLHEKLPGERFVVVDGPGQIDRALAELPAPEIVFGMRSGAIPIEDYHRVRDLPSLAWWHVAGSGYEWMTPWNRERLRVTNAAGVLAPFLADTTMGAIIALNNGLLAYREDQRSRRWAPVAFPPLEGQCLAVVGAGAIGQALAHRAQRFGLRVVGLTRSGAALPGFDTVVPLSQLDAVIEEADIVSCHLRLAPETENMFDAGRFARMKPGALFLNSARGGHVDEPALEAALRSGHLRGAWLDVFRTEPLPAESPLWEVPNLLITPHASDQVEGWTQRFAAFFADNLLRYRAGKPLINEIR